MPFSNDSTSPTPTITSAASAITSPPPCCWIVGGTLAVGLNRWWSTTVNQTVATVITNFAQYDDTSVILNSTTLYRGPNETFAAASYGFYGQNSLAFRTLVAPFTLPTDILTGSATDLTGADAYAGTYVVNTTVQTFSVTDLRIASPTPYDYWMNYGILTFRPPTDNVTTPLITYEPSMCGYWSSATSYSISLGSLTTETTTRNYTSSASDANPASIVYFTQTYTYSETSTLSTSTFPATFYPNGMDYQLFYQGLPFPGMASNYSLSSGFYDWGATNLGRAYPYVQPLTTQVQDGQHLLDLPHDLTEWLASQPNISSQYPFIRDCYILPGVGQPTAHAVVDQVMETSSNFITMGGSAPRTTTMTSTSDGGAQGPTSEQALDTTSIPPAAQPVTQPTTSSADAPLTTESSTQTTILADQETPNGSPTAAGAPQTDANPSSSAGGMTAATQDGASPVTSSQGTLTTDNDVGNLLGAIGSVAGQETTGANSPTGSTTAQAGAPDGASTFTDASFEGPASPTNPPATTPPAVVDGQPVYSGAPTVINGQTVSISGNNLIIASGASTRTEMISDTAAVATPPATLDGQPVYSGTPTVINGQTVSISGDSLIIASGSSTRMEGLGGAIMSGLGGATTTSTDTGVIPAAYTGGTERLGSGRSSLAYIAAFAAMMGVM